MAKTTDDEARDDIIKAARMFLKEVLASKGRRTDVESNAFWAAAVALIPADVLVNRKGRAVMRLLDIDYRVIKKASEMRGVLDDGSRRWATVKTSTHCDVSEWSLLINWLHSDEASHEDNTHKAPVRIDITLTSQQNPTSTSFTRSERTTTPKFACTKNFSPPLPSLQ